MMETELAEIDQRLQEDGLGPGASPVERQLHLWRLLQSSESSLQSTSQDLQALRMQQAAEMKERFLFQVENYMEHIRGLLEERELLMAEYEHENEQLHSELQQIKLQHDAQLKEVVEMLDQEGLAEISYSSPSEQVAYLLVERSTLLERLEATDRKLDTQSLTGHPREIPQEVQGEAMPEEHAERQRLERDLDEASRRLAMAHQEIRHLTDELDSARKTQAVHDVAELQKAKEHNERLDQEIRALRGRVRVLDSERKTLLEMVPCLQQLEDKDCRVRELQRRLQKLQTEQEELVERNEELESLLGEAQNLGKAEREHHESEVEGLQRKVRLEVLEGRLVEEKEWRKQLELDLAKAQVAIKTDKELDSLHVEVSWLQNTLEEERLLARQNQLALQAQISEAQARAKVGTRPFALSQDSLLQQKGEESKQLRQELQRVQGLFTSAEKELRYEREKNLDLKRHNALLDQEKIKLSAELKQAQSKVNQLEQSNQVQSTETERLRHRVRELELEATRCAQIQQAHDGLQEELNTERIRVIAADKKVLELQQQVKSLLHQLRLEETRAQEASRLEKDMREMSDTLSELRAKLQEDQLQRGMKQATYLLSLL
ncbi:coiled-coil domain-containing protein 30-like [Scleropages formosus]|uniref:Coiled-coil domain-containing protein 30-like n=1 Tax=Scleropages formosus TaxID=113540 RepID=A0A0P7YGU1_SCLFO|nr:coiled-coil domain-containing protein 30-like [Scleropages formosus]